MFLISTAALWVSNISMCINWPSPSISSSNYHIVTYNHSGHEGRVLERRKIPLNDFMNIDTIFVTPLPSEYTAR